MKKALLVVMIFLASFSINTFAQASMLTVNVDGMALIAPDTIWTYQMIFGIEGSADGIQVVFNETTQHQWEVVPGVSVTNWQLDSAVNPSEVIILGTANNDGYDAPLVDGELFTVTYGDDTVLSLTMESFLLSSDYETPVAFNIIPRDAVFGAGDDNVLTLSNVPIPASILLLGSGLLGLIGIRRKSA